MPYAVNLADITGRERQVVAGALIAPVPSRVLLTMWSQGIYR
jgi:hypothetical protein